MAVVVRVDCVDILLRSGSVCMSLVIHSAGVGPAAGGGLVARGRCTHDEFTAMWNAGSMEVRAVLIGRLRRGELRFQAQLPRARGNVRRATRWAHVTVEEQQRQDRALACWVVRPDQDEGRAPGVSFAFLLC